MAGRSLLVAALACAGCGRLAFDPLEGDGGGTSGRHYRRHFIVKNVAATAILDDTYSIRIPLSIDPGKALATRADVRLLRGPQPPGDSSSAGTARELLLAPNGDALWMALGVQLLQDETTEGYLYYGNPNVLGVDGSAFRLFDDFNNGIVGPSWLVQGAPTGTPDGNAIVLGPGDVGLTTDAATAGIPGTAVLEVRAQLTNPAGPGNYYWMGFQHLGDFGSGPPFINWVGGSFMPGADMNIHAWINTTMSRTGLDVTQDTAFHTYRIERGAASTRFYRDDVLDTELLFVDPTAYSIQVRNNSTTSSLVIPWVRARPLMEPEPTVTFDPEEEL